MVYKLTGESSSQSALCLRSYSNMNYYQLTKLLLVLSCINSDVLAVHPSTGGFGAGGYNQPGSGIGGGYRSGEVGVGGYTGKLSQSYGTPGGGSDTFGRSSITSGAFGGQSSYRQSQFGGSGGRGYQDAGGYQGGYGRDSGRPQPYNFHYEVNHPPSGNDYSHHESSDGNVVQGEYRVLLPDSRTQVVRYTADDANGYNADVQYEGQAQFSQSGGSGRYQGGGYGGGQGGYQGSSYGGSQGGYQGSSYGGSQGGYQGSGGGQTRYQGGGYGGGQGGYQGSGGGQTRYQGNRYGGSSGGHQGGLGRSGFGGAGSGGSSFRGGDGVNKQYSARHDYRK